MAVVEQVVVQTEHQVQAVALRFLEHLEHRVQVVLLVKAAVHLELLAHQELRVRQERQEHLVQAEHLQVLLE